MRCLVLSVLSAALPLSGNALRGHLTTDGPKGGNDTAWYRYRSPGAELHPHLDDAQWSGDVVQDLVRGHNAIRARVGLQGLTEDAQLRESSEAAVHAIATSHGCEIYHTSSSSRLNTPHFYYVGENLYKVEGMKPTGGGIVDAWYAELQDYRYGEVGQSCTKACLGRTNPPCQTGHFTQMMWQETTSIGCGVAACESQEDVYITVCQYGPGGNLVGNRPFDPHVAGALQLSRSLCTEHSLASFNPISGSSGAGLWLIAVLVAAAAVLFALRK